MSALYVSYLKVGQCIAEEGVLLPPVPNVVVDHVRPLCRLLNTEEALAD